METTRNTGVFVLALVLCVGLDGSGLMNKAVAAQDDDGDRTPATEGQFAGSAGCRDCHEGFYRLWAPSRHGLAMQPVTDEFARTQLLPQKDEIRIGGRYYIAEFKDGKGRVRERGGDEEKTYPIFHVLGGKNVYYFLTRLEKGRLQTLPVAYDVRRAEWFDTAASGMRHIPGLPADQAVHWKERAYTFNTSCYGCHVSQLSTNYDPETDTYHTEWAEPGINCETCHGPAGEHVRVFRAASRDRPPEALEIISTRRFNEQQTNDLCAPCHAKMSVLTDSSRPGDRFFDNFDLVTLEHTDFYPDGRDLGENYTYTLWRMSPCAKSGELDCMHCHTPSGRYRHKDNPNQSCLPCHQQWVETAAEHSHHPAGSEGSRCIACHMPATEFARMRRSDHSMLPPTPAATLAFKSPNACNSCHTDQDASWADRFVRQWHAGDYQAPVLHRAGLIASARRQEWSHLPEILEYLKRADRDEIYSASLIRLLAACDDERARLVVAEVMRKDPSPLVRASAAGTLSSRLTPDSVEALLAATRDDYRLVRVRAAAALAAVPPELVEGQARKDFENAVNEFMVSAKARPDDAFSHYNLGNFYSLRREYERAIECFETATRLDPALIPSWVNASLAYSAAGRNDKAEASLREALSRDPGNAAANFNLGLLLLELGRSREGEAALRAALKTDPGLAAAAYNLCVLLSEDRIDEAITWCRRASELRPDEPKYAYTLAYYLRQSGDVDSAAEVLERMVDRQMPDASAYLMLGEIYTRRGRTDAAIAVYRKAVANENLSPRDRHTFAARVAALSSP